MKYITIYITTKDIQEARKIGDILLKERLVGCVNIIKDIESLYWWEGKIENNTEVLIMAKSRHDLSQKIIEAVKKYHSYSVPCINIIPIEQGNEDYFRWLCNETQK